MNTDETRSKAVAAARLAAAAWLTLDPDPATALETRRLLESDDDTAEALLACYGKRLQFGTAGIRGVLGPGPGRMNRALVQKVTAGLAHYLTQTVPDAKARGVVVGHDARRGSVEFAADTCAVLSAAGFRVIACKPLAPTPLVAFALKHLDAAAGVVVTASHNPPAYNGYKVYWDNGAQIVPPTDAGIAAAIDAVQGAPALSEDRIEPAPDDLEAAYLEAIRAQVAHLPADGPAPTVVYTPMHGVGGPLCEAVLRAEGARVEVVTEQSEPDGTFPTVAFPNPEEAGALDLADALAERTRADLILANDPDADRLSVTVRRDGALRRLSGDELGWVLADALLEARGREANQRDRAFTARSIVSSDLLGPISEHHGARSLETLTGFKWLWNAAIDEIQAGGTFVFAYEEAIGYSVGSAVRDKDGIGAAAAVARIQRSDRSLWSRLQGIWERHGHTATRLYSVIDASPGGLARLAQRVVDLRQDPPTALDGASVLRFRDFAAPGDLPPTNCIGLYLDGARVMIRPSGTEPKLKLYLQVAAPWETGVEARADKRLTALENAVLKLVARP
jgi:phosphomannomutase